MTIYIGDVYRNEEGLWLVFGFQVKEEGERVLLIKNDPSLKKGSIAEATTFREIDPEDLIGEYALAQANEKEDAVVAWRSSMAKLSLEATAKLTSFPEGEPE